MPNSDSPITAQWVKGYYSGEQAKYIKGLANAGIGYKIISEPDKHSVIAAFRRPSNDPLPEHLEVIVNPSTLNMLEKWIAQS